VPHHPLPVGGAAAACRWHLQPLYYFSCHRPISLTWVEYNPTKTSRQLMLHHAVFLLKTSATLKARKKTSLHILKIVRVTWCEGIIYKNRSASILFRARHLLVFPLEPWKSLPQPQVLLLPIRSLQPYIQTFAQLMDRQASGYLSGTGLLPV
jgi:hypothetical protein